MAKSQDRKQGSSPAVQGLFDQASRYHKAGQLAEAERLYRQILSVEPRHVDTLHLLGVLAHQVGRPDIAVDLIGQAVALKPDYIVAHYSLRNLGQSLQNQGKFEEARGCYERALALKPDSVETLNDLGNVSSAQGRPDEAIAFYKRALALKPELAPLHSNLLLAMIYTASVSPPELTAAAREFARCIADPLRRQRPFVNDWNPERKLRIGYVSPDFCDHPVNYFLEPLLNLHDRDKFEIFAYTNTVKEDAVTARLKQKFDHWRDIRNLSDDEAADLIESDAIDILVDIAGHAADNRLLVFARKPAPIQATWLGYPATTGLEAIDYRITDSYADPVGMSESLNVERLWRLPDMFCCYQAHENSPAVIDRPPFEDNGYVTFGCFNHFSKVGDLVLAAWARILEQAPESRLLLEIVGLDGPQRRAEVEERLQRFGLPLNRVILESRKKSNQFVLYNRIDIALDPFPCNGGTTSMDTLWMGVPFITLAGQHLGSRLGVTVLSNAGLVELIGKTTDEYVRLAVDLAFDHERLRKLRHHLRDKVAVSPLMDQDKFTRNIEVAYREMWRTRCAAQSGTE
jgi:predicted O-linked N-acetylglucosamine transferase (SPINDLY family)